MSEADLSKEDHIFDMIDTIEEKNTFVGNIEVFRSSAGVWWACWYPKEDNGPVRVGSGGSKAEAFMALVRAEEMEVFEVQWRGNEEITSTPISKRADYSKVN
jgi:hypothetical protein